MTYHLLLQDRVEDARAVFKSMPPPPGAASVDPDAAVAEASGRKSPVSWFTRTAASARDAIMERLHLRAREAAAVPVWSVMQYDYIAAYLAFFDTDLEGLSVARRVAAAYSGVASLRWKAKFQALAEQVRVPG